MKIAKRYKSLYLPAFTIVAAVLVLLLVIAVSTYRNMNRERDRIEEALLRDGRIVIHTIEAALKADFRSNPPDILRLNTLLEDISRDSEIAGISIIDSEGATVAYSSLRETDRKIGGPSLNLLLREKGMVARYGHDQAGEKTFEIVFPLRLFPSDYPMSVIQEKAKEAKWEKNPLIKWSQDKNIVLSFRLRAFEAAKWEDIRHIALMGAILIVLGTGTLYFIFIVHNYYRVDRTLGQIRTYMENVVDSMADGLISLDNGGHIVTLNRQAAEILGAEIEELKGKKITGVLGGEISLIISSARDDIIRDRTIELGKQKGGSVPLSLSAAPLKDEMGQEMGLVLLIKDMREIRELEEKVRRSERLASMGRLAAGMAHEIRNPLSSIRGFAQFFLNRFQDQKTEREYASIMIREVDRLNRVITELLDFARPKEPRREPCSMEEVIDYALRLTANDMGKKRVEVEKNYEGHLPPIEADHEQLAQAFLNLFLNALDAVGESGKIIVGLKKDTDRSVMNITIADTGTGIPLEDRERIFEPFFSTKKKGTGLGLAIVHRIIEMHGGEIRAESVAGGGTVFRIGLPVQEAGGVAG